MRIALVNSRKPRRIEPGAPWLRRTFSLAASIGRDGDVLRTSVGSWPYDAAVYAAGRSGGRLEVVVPPGMDDAAVIDLLPDGHPRDRLRLEPLSGAGGASGPPRGGAGSAGVSRQAGPLRDEAVISGADLVIAVAVRRGGNMEALLRARWEAGGAVQVMPPFGPATETDGNRRLIERGLPRLEPDRLALLEDLDAPGPWVHDDAQPDPRIDAVEPWTPGDAGRPMLFHYTRACEGPWPDQTRREYLEELWDGGGHRDAAATLRRILRTGRLIASGRLIRGGYPVVSLTPVPPSILAELHRYRRHLIRWDFEPYGIAIDREWLEWQGAAPVHYLPPEAFAALPELERPWYQKHQPPRCDYSAEQEWRWRGDLELDAVPRWAMRRVEGGASRGAG